MARLPPLLLLLLLLPTSVLASNYFEQIGWLKPDSHVLRVIQYPNDIENLYRSTGNHLIWLDIQQSTRLEFQLEVISNAGFSPLFARQLRYMEYYRKSNRWHEYDLLATDTLLLYISYAEQAKVLGYDWFFKSQLYKPLPRLNPMDLYGVSVAVEYQQLSALIDIYTPKNDDYQALIANYLHVIKFENLNVPLYEQDGMREIGDRLNNRELLLLRMEMIDVDLTDVRRDIDWYDVTLVDAIKQFQGLHGLAQDGIIGTDTLRWLNISPTQRLSMLALNAERGRLWPMERDIIIVVNVPGFDMKYWYSGQAIFESKVVVGSRGRPTPLMITNMDSLILNPTWNVPWKIMVEDIIPKVKKDPQYLVRQRINIIPKWGSKELIDPQEIDWQNMRPSSFPYRMTQLAGDKNALGSYKFNTPNRRAIFLHDTPSKNLFEETTRAFSSGCVRVENAGELATRLLETQGLALSSLNREAFASNKSIPLKQRVPVHIIYQTAWPEGGKVHYRDDIYRLDKLNSGRGGV
ncbi:L,D-transpeptidase family protein [Vibrio ostreicida]|uniref:L,D-transpeptidase family protein n=1 Tax=Vibrio ostreicida TaxID=526588 RepID=A0ABT8BT97_9VIBR|nr:L,D-transpeptidase family protein [Vibrio ostreicida]MDN3610201.1 L,D-transpeptidase family protein [Vibrio ostreicida]NPD07778.1 L,D-transpeptidase family protein [Vibrio ostreicida]